MSSYDDRIVRLGFDNAKFEKGANQSISTLDKLNEKLKLKGAEEGSQNLQRSVNNLDFSSMQKGIEAIERRFSTMGIVGMNVINKITDGITGSVAKLEQATIGQIKSGGWSRAMNIANAKFQIEGLGFAWQEVEKAVSYGVKDTAYGLDAAASAASQLAASGVDFQKTIESVNGQDLTAMHKSLRAISGVAAMTNSSYEDIARIFTTVAGNGRLMGDQLLQLSSRGMNAAAKLAETLGTTEGEIRDMVSKGQIDFQTFAFAMDDAFGAHAKEANKTFTGALGNMKAALSRVGEIFADPIINKTNTLFISLTERIDEFKNKLKSIKLPKSFEDIKKEYGEIANNAAAYNEIVKENGEKVITFGKHFAEMWQAGIDAFSAMIKSVDLSWFDKIVEKVDSVTVKITEFFNLIKEVYGESAEEAADQINDATKTLLVSAEEAQAAKDVILKGMYGTGAKRQNALAELFGGGEEGKQHAKNVQTYIDSVVAAGWDFEKTSIKIADANELVADSIKDEEREAKKAKLKETLESIRKTMSNLWAVAKNVGKAAASVINPIIKAFNSVFKMDLSTISGGAVSLTGKLVELSEKLIITDDTAEKVKKGFEKLFGVVQNFGSTIKTAGENAWEFITTFKDSEGFKKISDALTGLWESFKGLGDIKLFSNIKNNIVTFFQSLSFDGIGEKISGFFSSVKGALDKQDDGKKGNKKDEAGGGVADIIASIISGVTAVIDQAKKVPDKIKDFASSMQEAISAVDVLDVVKLAGKIYAIVTIFRFLSTLKDLSDLFTKIAAIPAKISSVIGNFATLVSSISEGVKIVTTVMLIKAVANAILEIFGALIIVAAIPPDDIYRAVSIFVLVAGVVVVLAKILSKMNETSANIAVNIKVLTRLAANMIGLGVLIASIGGAIIMIATAFAIITKAVGDPDVMDRAMTVMGAVLLSFLVLTGVFLLFGKQLKSDLKEGESLLSTFIGMSVLMGAIGGSILLISMAVATISVLPETGFSHAIETIALIFGGMVLIIFMTRMVSMRQAFGAAALMLAIAGAMTLMASAIAIIAFVKPSDDTINAVKSLILVTTIVFAAIALLSKLLSKDSASIKNTILMVIAFESLFMAIAGALFIISLIKNADQAANVLNSVLGVFALLTLILGAVAIVGAVTGGADALKNAAEMMLSLSVAVIALSAGMLILSMALKNMGDVDTGILIGFVIALGVVLAAIGVLIGFAASMPIIISAMDSVGNMFLLIGVGALAAAVGLYVVVAALGKLPPIILGLSVSLAALFEVIKNNKAEAIIVGVIVVAIVAAVVFAIVRLISALSGLVNAIGGALTIIFQYIGNASKNVENKMDKDKKGLSTKAKTMIVTIITTLCAAILKASPTVLDMIGKLIIKLFTWLGKISGKIALALVDFLIELIYGVTDAIELNSERIAAAFWGLVIALWDVIIQVVGKMIALGLRTIGEYFHLDLLTGWADKVEDGVGTISGILMKKTQELRTSAEIAAKSKKEYAEAYYGIATEAEGAADRIETANNNLFGSLGSLSSQTKETKSDLESLKEEYAGLPGYAYDAMLSSQNGAYQWKKTGANSGASFTEGLVSEIPGHGGGGGSWDVSAAGFATETGYDEASMECMGESASTSMAYGLDQPKEYNTAMTDNMDATKQAIVDSQDDVETAVDEHINKPAVAKINGNWKNMYTAGEYIVDGLCSAITSYGSKLKVEGAMGWLSNTANNSFTGPKGINSNSPSKVYYKFGTYMVQGLTNAIYDNSDIAANSMIELSDTIVSAFGSPFERISKIMDGELVYDSAIRPVFDDTNLYQGASSINGMLSNQTVTVAGMSGKLSADIGQLDTTNSSMVEQLMALREEMAVMTDEMTNMKVVMDTGALVGQMAGPMDRTMGQRAIYKRRGN